MRDGVSRERILDWDRKKLPSDAAWRVTQFPSPVRRESRRGPGAGRGGPWSAEPETFDPVVASSRPKRGQLSSIATITDCLTGRIDRRSQIICPIPCSMFPGVHGNSTFKCRIPCTYRGLRISTIPMYVGIDARQVKGLISQ